MTAAGGTNQEHAQQGEMPTRLANSTENGGRLINFKKPRISFWRDLPPVVIGYFAPRSNDE